MGTENKPILLYQDKRVVREVPSDIDPSLFPTPENIEALIEKGRVPVRFGRKGSLPSGPNRKEGDTWKLSYVYTVPPVNVNSSGIKKEEINFGGMPLLTQEDGSQIFGLAYHVTENQAKRIDGIIEKHKRTK